MMYPYKIFVLDGSLQYEMQDECALLLVISHLKQAAELLGMLLHSPTMFSPPVWPSRWRRRFTKQCLSSRERLSFMYRGWWPRRRRRRYAYCSTVWT